MSDSSCSFARMTTALISTPGATFCRQVRLEADKMEAMRIILSVREYARRQPGLHSERSSIFQMPRQMFLRKVQSRKEAAD